MMKKGYVKPEILEETTMDRKLVYADPETQFTGCSTLVQKIETKDDEAKLT